MNCANLLNTKKFLQIFIFVFDSLECLQQLTWNNRPVYPLILHPWKPKAIASYREADFLCAKPLCKYRIGQLSSSQGISYGKPSGDAHSTSRVTRSFSCEESCGLFFIFHFVSVQLSQIIMQKSSEIIPAQHSGNYCNLRGGIFSQKYSIEEG